MKEMKVKIEFIERVLGTASSNKDIYLDFIASKTADKEKQEEELESISMDEVERKETTVFPRNEDGLPILWDYQIRGFFKSACGFLRKVSGTKSSKCKAYKKQIDGLIFVNERQIVINTDQPTGNWQRPLRGQAGVKEIIALANSECIEAGATCEFTIRCLSDDDLDLVREWMDYGIYNGIGQWRNSGCGRFVWSELDADGNVIGGNYNGASSIGA